MCCQNKRQKFPEPSYADIFVKANLCSGNMHLWSMHYGMGTGIHAKLQKKNCSQNILQSLR